MTTSEDLFIWVYLPGQQRPVVAGRLSVSQTAAGKVGHFTYGRSYLERQEAIPIDPVALPLKKGEFTFTSLSGFPGAILDSCPDRWGVKVIDRLVGQQDYPRGYILRNDPGRAGALAFSSGAKDVPQEQVSREFSLAQLLAAAEDVEADRPVDSELLKALHPGTGGARPKCNIVENNAVWIAKFPSIDDEPRISIPRLEHATMQLGRLCGISTAETLIREVDGRDVCLVRRFDREVTDARIGRCGFLSARSVFHADPAYAAVSTPSYARLSRWMPRYGCTEVHRKALFGRMVFNCVVKNVDDHELNHGLLHVQGDTFELAPAYDIVPSLKRHAVYHHAMLVGDSGAGTIANLVSVAEAFTLDRDEALAVIHEIQRTTLKCWRDVFYEAGFGDEELRAVEPVFQALPEGH